MRIAVIGAADGVGSAAVDQALGHGDTVNAIAGAGALRSLAHERLTVHEGDVRRAGSLREGISGCDAVISAIEARWAPQACLFSAGIANVMEAMIEEGVSRLVALSASGAFARNDPNLSLWFRLFVVGGFQRGVYEDLERMEQRIVASSLDWTIVRPAALTDGRLTGDYRVGLDGRPLKGGARVSRADVAAFLLKSLTSDRWLRRAVSVAY